MFVSLRQIKAARALLGWSQGQLAQKSGVSYPTIARLEALDGEIGGRRETVDKIVATLQAAGIEFTHGAELGVKLRTEATMSETISTLSPFNIVSSSLLAVRLHTFDGELPVNVVVERSAIDDYFRVNSSTKEFRRRVVELNLDAIRDVTLERHRQRRWSMGQSAGGKFLQIVLRYDDLRNATLVEPPEGPQFRSHWE